MHDPQCVFAAAEAKLELLFAPKPSTRPKGALRERVDARLEEMRRRSRPRDQVTSCTAGSPAWSGLAETRRSHGGLRCSKDGPGACRSNSPYIAETTPGVMPCEHHQLLKVLQ